MGARALILFVLAACTGPRPEAHVVAVAPAPQPGHERVTIDLANAAGHGQVELRITLHGTQTIPATQMVELRAHDHLHVIVDVPAPPGDYTATVAVDYPD